MQHLQKINTQNGILWITDSLTEARRLKNEGEAVLIRLTEENRKEDFSEFPYAVEELEHMDEETKELYFDRVYRRLRGIPWDILETERCYLRETTVEDVHPRLYQEPIWLL